MFDTMGQQKIEIDENTEFELPIKINGYEANNMKELRELFECNVITLQKYEDLVSQLEMGEIGIIKKRKHYKELYEEELNSKIHWRNDYFKLAQVISKIKELRIPEVEIILEKENLL